MFNVGAGGDSPEFVPRIVSRTRAKTVYFLKQAVNVRTTPSRECASDHMIHPVFGDVLFGVIFVGSSTTFHRQNQRPESSTLRRDGFCPKGRTLLRTVPSDKNRPFVRRRPSRIIQPSKPPECEEERDPPALLSECAILCRSRG